MTITDEGRASKPATVADLISANSRILSRPIGNFMVDEIARLTPRFDGDYVMALVELSIIQATRPSGDAQSDRKRSISARAIGLSLGLPYETCRRKVRDLEAAGVCRRVSANRLVIVPEPLEAPTKRNAPSGGAIFAVTSSSSGTSDSIWTSSAMSRPSLR